MNYKYVSAAERKIKNQKKLATLKKKNPNIQPITIPGRKIASTWWGISWNKNLESYADFSNRISRGRSYLRHGSVADLQLSEGKVKAKVLGSKRTPYDVVIQIDPLNAKKWDEIARDSSGKIESMQALIEGKFPKELESLFTQKENGLFPSPDEIHFNCSCPDYAYMCKHVAAVLYGIGARLDETPELFFTLRNVNIDDLVSKSIEEHSTSLLEKSENKSDRVLDEDAMDLFDI